MAIIAIASPVSGIRGKVGGNIYSANKSGPYLKAWGRGSNPRTELQTSHRASLVQFSQSWAAISASNKTDWDTYAALPAQDKTNSLGETFSVSGFAWFVGINMNRFVVGSAQLDTAPTVAIPGVPIIFSARLKTTGAASDSFVRLDVSSPGLTDFMAAYCTLYNSEGRTVASQVKTRLLTQVPDAGRFVIFQDEVEERFGEIFLGQRAFYEVRTQNSDGRQGATASISIGASS